MNPKTKLRISSSHLDGCICSINAYFFSSTYNVQNAPQYPELPTEAKTIPTKSLKPFQVVVRMEGKDKVAIIHPKFI